MKVRAPLLHKLLFAAVAIAAGLLTAPSVSGQNQKESFTGNAINMDRAMNSKNVDFTIERWSTDAEREQLLGILKAEKDPYKANEKMVELLRKMPKVGSVRLPTSLAWDLHYARQTALDEGGRQIVVATDRPIGFGEASKQTRTMDYPFSIIQIQIDKDGKGEGKILPGTRIYIDKKNNLVLENYAQQPTRFNNVRKVS